MDEGTRKNLLAALEEIRLTKSVGFRVVRFTPEQMDALEDACVLALEQ